MINQNDDYYEYGQEMDQIEEDKDETDGSDKLEYSYTDTNELQEESNVQNTENTIMSLKIVFAEALVFNSFCIHPCIRVHIMDEETGQYVRKSDQERPVIQQYELATQVDNTQSYYQYILPFITEPYHLRKKTFPVWNQQFCINELFSHLTRPSVVFIFEVMEFNRPSFDPRDLGWYPLAWGFLRGSSIPTLDLRKDIPIQMHSIPASLRNVNQLTRWPSAPRTYPLGFYLYMKSLGCTLPLPSGGKPPSPGAISAALRDFHHTGTGTRTWRTVLASATAQSAHREHTPLHTPASAHPASARGACTRSSTAAAECGGVPEGCSRQRALHRQRHG